MSIRTNWFGSRVLQSIFERFYLAQGLDGFGSCEAELEINELLRIVYRLWLLFNDLYKIYMFLLSLLCRWSGYDFYVVWFLSHCVFLSWRILIFIRQGIKKYLHIRSFSSNSFRPFWATDKKVLLLPVPYINLKLNKYQKCVCSNKLQFSSKLYNYV